GVMQMRDDKGLDDKVLAVNIGDPAFGDYRDFRELPRHVVREMVRFFQDYKALEGKQVAVDEPRGVDVALRVLREALASYRAHGQRAGSQGTVAILIKATVNGAP